MQPTILRICRRVRDVGQVFINIIAVIINLTEIVNSQQTIRREEDAETYAEIV